MVFKDSFLQWGMDYNRPVWPGVKKDVEYNKFYVDAWTSAVTLNPATPVVPEIERVIFNGPATIVFWSDNTKTVVKCMEGELFDEEKGIAMAVMKKLYGKGYMNKIRRHISWESMSFYRGRKNVEN